MLARHNITLQYLEMEKILRNYVNQINYKKLKYLFILLAYLMKVSHNNSH